MRPIFIEKREIGMGKPVYIVAEMSANHNQSLAYALEIIQAAKEAGADAVKIQTYTKDTLTLDCDNEHFRLKGTLHEGKTLYELYDEAHTPWEWQTDMKDYAVSLGLDLFSTPFDVTAVSFLEEIDVPAYKVASSEIVDIPLLKNIAATGKPIILSVGMASLGEIEEAISAVRMAGNTQIAILKCTAAYPAKPEEMNLITIPNMIATFDVPVGLSDHTLGIEVSVAAVALGACIIEKHFTISRDVKGPDSPFSMEYEEFRRMVEAIRNVEKARGRIKYGVVGRETISFKYRRSLFVTEDICEGEIFTGENIRSIRPGNGLAPRYLSRILGRKARRNLKKGTPLSWEYVD